MNAGHEVRYVALPLVGAAVLGTAALHFFWYPLEKELWLFAVIVGALVWLVAVAMAVAGVVVAGRRGGARTAAVPAVIALLGFAVVVRTDLQHGYPYAYYRAHREQFAVVAELLADVGLDEDGYGATALPPELRLGAGYADVGVAADGERVAVVWVSYASGFGYGYGHAPAARRGKIVLLRPATVGAQRYLGDGWWWVDTVVPERTVPPASPR